MVRAIILIKHYYIQPTNRKDLSKSQSESYWILKIIHVNTDGKNILRN